MNAAESLFQALIPSGTLLSGFEVPKTLNEFIVRVCNDETNLTILGSSQIELFFLSYKCICVCKACTFGVPSNLSNQAQIFRYTFTSSMINYYLSLLQKFVDGIPPYCKNIQTYISCLANSAQSRDLFKTTILSLKQQRSLINLIASQLELHCDEIESFVQLPRLNSHIQNLSDNILTLLKTAEEFLTDQTAVRKSASNSVLNLNTNVPTILSSTNSTQKVVDKSCNQIVFELIPQITTMRQASATQLKSLFEPHYSKPYQNFVDFVSNFISELANLIFEGLSVAIFSTSDSGYFALLYKIAKDSLTIITNVHSLMRFRCNYKLAVVTIKISYQQIHNSFQTLVNQIQENLKASPNAFQTTSSCYISRTMTGIMKFDTDFIIKSDTFFSRLRKSKKFIVFSPITMKNLIVNPLSNMNISFQKSVYMVAHSLIKNHYRSQLFEGMTKLIHLSYRKLIELIGTQVSSKVTNDQRISYIHKKDNVEYAMTLFVATFSEFSENENETMATKSALVALNLIFEVCIFDSDPETTELLNSSFMLLLEILKDDKKEKTSAFYLLYRRSIKLALFHNTCLVSRFFKTLMKQIKISVDNNEIENLMAVKKMNDSFLHFLKSIQRSVFYDKSFNLPYVILDTVQELKSFVDNLSFKSDHHQQTCLKSIENFIKIYQELSFFFDHVDNVQWNVNISDFAAFISDAKGHLESFGNLIHTLKEFSSNAFGLVQNLFDLTIIARNIGEIPEKSIATIDENSWIILENSTYINRNLQKVVEAAKLIAKELDTFSNVVISFDNQSSITHLYASLLTNRLRQNRSSLVKMKKALQSYKQSLIPQYARNDSESSFLNHMQNVIPSLDKVGTVPNNHKKLQILVNQKGINKQTLKSNVSDNSSEDEIEIDFDEKDNFSKQIKINNILTNNKKDNINYDNYLSCPPLNPLTDDDGKPPVIPQKSLKVSNVNNSDINNNSFIDDSNIVNNDFVCDDNDNENNDIGGADNGNIVFRTLHTGGRKAEKLFSSLRGLESKVFMKQFETPTKRSMLRRSIDTSKFTVRTTSDSSEDSE